MPILAVGEVAKKVDIRRNCLTALGYQDLTLCGFRIPDPPGTPLAVDVYLAQPTILELPDVLAQPSPSYIHARGWSDLTENLYSYLLEREIA